MQKESNLKHSHAKQFQKSPFKAEDSFDGFGDPYFIEGKDPGRAYKDISYDSFKKNGFRDIRGWIPLTQGNKTTEVMPEPEQYGVKGDGLFHRGDCIVAWMPKERYAQMRARITSQIKMQEESAMGGGEAASLGRKIGYGDRGKTNIMVENEE